MKLAALVVVIFAAALQCSADSDTEFIWQVSQRLHMLKHAIVEMDEPAKPFEYFETTDTFIDDWKHDKVFFAGKIQDAHDAIVLIKNKIDHDAYFLNNYVMKEAAHEPRGSVMRIFADKLNGVITAYQQAASEISTAVDALMAPQGLTPGSEEEEDAFVANGYKIYKNGPILVQSFKTLKVMNVYEEMKASDVGDRAIWRVGEFDPATDPRNARRQ